MADSRDRYDVFISYCHRDRGWVEELKENLEESGVRVFWDVQQITRPEDIETKIKVALEEARFLLLVLTPASIASPWVRTELDRMRAKVLIARVAAAPLPAAADIPEEDQFDFEGGPELTASRYRRKYRESFRRLCERLGHSPVEPSAVSRPHEDVPRRIYDSLVEVLHDVLAWPATKRGVSAALKLGWDALDTEPEGRMAANFLIHRLSEIKSLPKQRACRMLIEQVKQSCRLDEEVLEALDRVLFELENIMAENVDDEFVRSVGRALGQRYDIRRILGGHSTVVLEANDVTLRRRVTVKVLRPPVRRNAAGRTRRSRSTSDAFRRYVTNAASLRHRAFPAVHGARFEADLNLFISDYAEGVSLSSLIRLGEPLSVPIVNDVLRQAGDALEYLEHQGLVHTYLNPENMFVSTGGDLTVSPMGIVRQAHPVLPLPDLYAKLGHPLRRAGVYTGPRVTEQTELNESAHQFPLGMIVAEVIGASPVSVGEDRPSVRDFREAAMLAMSGGVKGTVDSTKSASVVAKLLTNHTKAHYQSAGSAVRALVRAIRADEREGRLTVPRCTDLAAMVETVEQKSEQRTTAGAKAAESLANVMSEEFVARFQSAFHADQEVESVFLETWRKSSIENPEVGYRKKLREALETIVKYGRYPAYEALELERVVASHRERKIHRRLYRVFRDALLDTLERWEPPFGVESAMAEEYRAAWTTLLDRVVAYVPAVDR